jgi:site-specific recombinase XerD
MGRVRQCESISMKTNHRTQMTRSKLCGGYSGKPSCRTSSNPSLGAPLSVAGYERMVARAGRKAKFPFQVHSHMLRHGCGYALINAGENLRAIQQHLGHKSINSTVRYTKLAPAAFKRRVWRD